jgi:hypothetical protein
MSVLFASGEILIAAALPFSNVSVEAAGSRGSSAGGSAVTPLIGAYVLSNKMDCGGSSGFASLSSAGDATFFADAWDPYQTWRNARSLPDPTNQTTYSSLGFNSSATIPETPVQWGRIETIQFQRSASAGSSAVPPPGVYYGRIFFIVTAYPFPAAQGPYSSGYLLYLYFGTPSPASWHQATLAVNNPGSMATVVSAEMTLLLSSGACAQQIELHK